MFMFLVRFPIQYLYSSDKVENRVGGKWMQITFVLTEKIYLTAWPQFVL